MELMNKFVSRGRRTASRILEGSAVILLLPDNSTDRNDSIFQLGPVGTFFWKLLEDDPRVSSIVVSFMKKFSFSRREAVKQASDLIRRLRKKKLIEVRNKPDKAGKPWLR